MLIYKPSRPCGGQPTNQKVVGSNPAGLTNREVLKSASRSLFLNGLRVFGENTDLTRSDRFGIKFVRSDTYYHPVLRRVSGQTVVSGQHSCFALILLAFRIFPCQTAYSSKVASIRWKIKESTSLRGGNEVRYRCCSIAYAEKKAGKSGNMIWPKQDKVWL